MADTNYISSMIKILEYPKQKNFKNNIILTTIRGQLPQIRETRIITLFFWGNLGQDISKHYQVNDYIIIEGYIGIKKRQKYARNLKLKEIHITVLKVYPGFLNNNLTINK